jgi:hypothetical protein
LNHDRIVFLQAKLSNGQKFGDNAAECRTSAFCIAILVALVHAKLHHAAVTWREQK